MSTFAIAHHAEEMRAASATYTPENMNQFGQDLRRLPDAFRDVAEALRITVQRVEGEYPVDARIAEILADAYNVQLRVAEALETAAPAFHAFHEADLRRHEAPRPGERMWNV